MKRSMLLPALFAVVMVFINLSAAKAAILAGNHPAAVETHTAVGNADSAQPLTMDIRFNLRNTAELQALITAQHDPSSPDYHRWLKTGEFDERFGPRPSDVNAVLAWLASEGFTVESAADGHIEFSGNVAQAQRSFAVRIASFGDGSTYANIEDPAIPEQFAGVIASIRGLDNMMRVRPAGLHLTPPVSSALGAFKSQIFSFNSSLASQPVSQPEGVTPLFSDGGIEAFGPEDMHTFYNETVQSGSDGSGSCIALIGVSEVAAAALAAFDKQFGLPATKLTQTVVGKNPGQTRDNSEIEAELDVEWSHSMAPKATETLYIAAPTSPDPLAVGIGSAVKANKCATISISFSYCGAPSSEFTGVLDPLFQKAVTQGQSVFVSSGDQGAAALDSQCNTIDARGINEMSANPNVTSVGGTETFAQFDQNGNDTGYTEEQAWNSDNGATGGGVSGVFSKPSYQTGPGVPADANRDVPDLALIASPSLPGVFLGDVVMGPASIVCCIGGTSLSSPMMAGMVEVLDQQVGRLGQFNKVLYSLADAQYAPSGPDNGFHDVTLGDNNFNGVIGYNAGTGYDEDTGWGSIDFEVFASAVKANLPHATTTLTSTPPTINFGNVDASGKSKAHRVTLINKGTVNAIVGTLTAPTGFVIVSGSDTCSGQAIVTRKSCSVSLEFKPSAPGPASGALTIPYNGATDGSVSLSGNGTQVTLRKPATVVFAPVAAGTLGKAKPVSIMNPSATASVVLSAAALSGPYAPSTDTCSGATLAPHGRCAISLEFSPPPGSIAKMTMPGSLNFDYTYGSNPGSAPVTLTGTVR